MMMDVVEEECGKRAGEPSGDTKASFLMDLRSEAITHPPTLRRLKDMPPCQIGMPGIAVVWGRVSRHYHRAQNERRTHSHFGKTGLDLFSQNEPLGMSLAEALCPGDPFQKNGLTFFLEFCARRHSVESAEMHSMEPL